MNYRTFWTKLTSSLWRSKAGQARIVICRMEATVAHTGKLGSTKADLPTIHLLGNVTGHELEHLTSMSLRLSPEIGETLSLTLLKEKSLGINYSPRSTNL